MTSLTANTESTTRSDAEASKSPRIWWFGQRTRRPESPTSPKNCPGRSCNNLRGKNPHVDIHMCHIHLLLDATHRHPMQPMPPSMTHVIHVAHAMAWAYPLEPPSNGWVSNAACTACTAWTWQIATIAPPELQGLKFPRDVDHQWPLVVAVVTRCHEMSRDVTRCHESRRWPAAKKPLSRHQDGRLGGLVPLAAMTAMTARKHVEG